jgi:hypothetical protein
VKGQLTAFLFDLEWMTNMPDKYSFYGFHKMGSLRVYHQGGLDTYCGLYSVLNLINFLYLEKDLSYLRQNRNIAEEAVQAIEARVGDFIGADNPEVFKELYHFPLIRTRGPTRGCRWT